MTKIRPPQPRTLINLFIPIPKTESKLLTLVKDIILILLFTILTGVFAKIKIEIGPVPITFQTLAVLLSGALLGSFKGAMSQLTYLVFGLAGIPWFSRGGGFSYLFSPTFGYILGFVFAAFFVGFLCEKGWNKNLKRAILIMVSGNTILYLPGLFWLAKFIGFGKVLAVGFFPFLLGDILKILLAGSILPFGYKLLKGQNKD